MLDVILEENELCLGMPKSFEDTIIATACISFLLSPLQLTEIKQEENGNWGVRTSLKV